MSMMFDPEAVEALREQFKKLSSTMAQWQEVMGSSPYGEVGIGETCESTTDDDSFWEE